MHWLKSNRKLFAIIVMLLFMLIEIPIITIGQTSEPQNSDVIIILGAKLINGEPSTMLRLRLEQAAALYKAGYAPNIIVSGAKGKDETLSEASAMRRYLMNQGIPESTILLEENSFNTYQNLVNSKQIMQNHGWNKAIIVSNASHIRRALLIAEHIQLEATASPAPMAAHNIWLTCKQYLREGAATIAFWSGAY